MQSSIINNSSDINIINTTLNNYYTKIISDAKYLNSNYLSNITNNTTNITANNNQILINTNNITTNTNNITTNINNITTNMNNINTINTTLNNMSINLQVDTISSSNTTTDFITFDDEVKMTDTVIFEKAIVYNYTIITSSSFTINASSRKALYIVNHTSSTTITLNSLGVALDGMILKFRQITSNSLIFIKGNTSNGMLDLSNNNQNNMTFGSSRYIQYMYYFPTDRYILLQS